MGSSQKYWQFDRDCAPWASKIRDQCVLITTPSHGLLIGLSIEPYPLKLLKEDLDLVPHAALRIPVWDIAKFLRIDLENSHDDFDYYEGVSAISDKGINHPLPWATGRDFNYFAEKILRRFTGKCR